MANNFIHTADTLEAHCKRIGIFSSSMHVPYVVRPNIVAAVSVVSLVLSVSRLSNTNETIVSWAKKKCVSFFYRSTFSFSSTRSFLLSTAICKRFFSSYSNFVIGWCKRFQPLYDQLYLKRFSFVSAQLATIFCGQV